MSQLLLFLLSCYGLCFVVTDSKLPIMLDLREYLVEQSPLFQELLNCKFCTGWWCGLFIALATGISLHTTWQYALASATFCYLLDTVLLYLERK